MSGALHLTTVTRIVCKHRNQRFMSVGAVRDSIERCAAADEPDAVEARIIDNVQRATGMTIAQVVDLAQKRWPRD